MVASQRKMNEEIVEKLKSYDLVFGIDEVGRGPIAGPLTLCAFGVDEKHYGEVRKELSGITDSKKLSEKKREFYGEKIETLRKEKKLIISLSSVPANYIDEHGVAASIEFAMNSCLRPFMAKAKNIFVYLDGSLSAPQTFEQKTIIKGDVKNFLIGSASVVAKLHRDEMMRVYAKQYPGYGFEKHKGYGTRFHYEQIRFLGLSPIHRKTWIRGL